MSSWSIEIPFRDRSESLTVTAGHARVLGRPGDDRAEVARQIAIGALMDGRAATAGELIDHLEGLDPAERRAMLDRARAECGLPSIEDVEFRRGVEAMRRQSTFPVGAMCAVPDCTAVPMRNGAWYVPNVKRWHCSAHLDRARPGDMEPAGTGLRFGENGVIRPDDPADDEREAAAAESRRSQQQARQADRDRDAAAARARDEARREQYDRELPPHLRSRP
jgi:hypothetical protein